VLLRSFQRRFAANEYAAQYYSCIAVLVLSLHGCRADCPRFPSLDRDSSLVIVELGPRQSLLLFMGSDPKSTYSMLRAAFMIQVPNSGAAVRMDSHVGLVDIFATAQSPRSSHRPATDRPLTASPSPFYLIKKKKEIRKKKSLSLP
jgi:hypothetical protein